jgi:predicted AAA+ superfamily ATPase
MLPGKPKIFHGRQIELEEIIKLLNQDSARIVILGPGGIGKTSLAKAALHHLEVFPNYQHRYFVPCDSASTGIEVAAVIGAHLGLKPARDLTKAVLQYLSRQPASLLILDNLETAWDPIESRNGVEELLSQLTDIFHLALLVCIVFC